MNLVSLCSGRNSIVERKRAVSRYPLSKLDSRAMMAVVAGRTSS